MSFTEQELLLCFKSLKRYARSLSKENYEDLFQDTLEKAWAARTSFIDNGSAVLLTWLMQIMKNKNISNLRSYKCRTEAINIFPTDCNPNQIHTVALKQCFKLPLGKVSALQAYGYSYEEMGELMKCSWKGQKSAVFRFRENNKEAFV